MKNDPVIYVGQGDIVAMILVQKSPYQEFTDYLSKNHKPVGVQKLEVKQY